ALDEPEFDDELRWTPAPLHSPGEQTLPRWVAASGAFPGALRAIRIETGRWGPRYFADGGIIDNTGLSMLYNAVYLGRIEKHVQRNLVSMRNDSLVWEGKDLDPELVRILSETAMKHAVGGQGSLQWGLVGWDVDLVLASDGSAVAAGGQPASPMEELGMAVDALSRTNAGGLLSNRGGSPLGRRPVTLFLSPRLFGLTPAVFIRGDFNWSFEPVGREGVLGMTDLDSTTLARIIQRIPDREKRQRAEIAYGRLRRQSLIRHGRVVESFMVNSPDDGGVLYYAVRGELYFALRAFAQTSTLRDQVPAADARAIFALGQYVAFINGSAIQRYLATAEQHRAQRHTARPQTRWTYVAPPWVCPERGDCSTRHRSREGPHIEATTIHTAGGARRGN
ncbi:hypothetical protein, partial [Longimicrobium sp.]|uniref:hypothetical protein n=1 Tax=Longimicrobium sp. TaxID=2029185 RepID=UPI002E339856